MSHLDNGFRSLTLQRFPATDDVNPLQAWEAADEYLLQQLDDTEIRGPVLILNDAFGALSCALAEHKPYSIGDSYISELAYSAAIFLIPICISFDTAEKRRYATYLILNRRFSFEF